MRTCVHHGEESDIQPGSYRCRISGLFCCQREGGDRPPCFVPLPAAAPEPEKVPSSRPVTFAAVLRYHRRLAADPRADRAWHEEAVECLRELTGYLGEVCRPCVGEYDGEVCQYDRCLIWRARKAVEVER
jgi:hypothetical protein